MSLKKDKEKVLDEVWTEERVKAFLDIEPAAGIDKDFHVLLKAYQSMREENFEQFIGFFCNAGRDLNAIGPEGKTVLAEISSHRIATSYIESLKSYGAN